MSRAGAALHNIAVQWKREFTMYRLLWRHPATPRAAKVLLGAAIGYTLLPFDLIPDFLPVIGHFDDAIIVPALVLLARRFISPELLAECRALTDEGDEPKAAGAKPPAYP
ncbi:MAG: hypothetical protein JWN98_2278 [Abditibacteriota bacterium]|nr:hypothetical protein [Abditibacteriota bacterium]